MRALVGLAEGSEGAEPLIRVLHACAMPYVRARQVLDDLSPSPEPEDGSTSRTLRGHPSRVARAQMCSVGVWVHTGNRSLWSATSPPAHLD